MQPQVTINPESNKPDHAPRIIALQTWLTSSAGQYALAWEQAKCDQICADIFGFHALQMGLPQLEALRENRMPVRVMQDAHIPSYHDEARSQEQAYTHILAEPYELPFANASLDLVVLPHVLEFSEQPHLVLREVERVLIAEGRVLITGFNPLSLWGARQKIGHLVGHTVLPREGQFISVPRLKDWLKLLGFEVDRGHFGCYRPAVQNIDRYAFMDSMGDRWWPLCGAVYALCATKRIQGIRLIGQTTRVPQQSTLVLRPTS